MKLYEIIIENAEFSQNVGDLTNKGRILRIDESGAYDVIYTNISKHGGGYTRLMCQPIKITLREKPWMEEPNSDNYKVDKPKKGLGQTAPQDDLELRIRLSAKFEEDKKDYERVVKGCEVYNVTDALADQLVVQYFYGVRVVDELFFKKGKDFLADVLDEITAKANEVEAIGLQNLKIKVKNPMDDAKLDVVSREESLTGMAELKIYKFQAKQIEDTFRLVARTLESKTKETSLDRDVMQSWEMIKNVLAGKIDEPVKRM